MKKSESVPTVTPKTAETRNDDGGDWLAERLSPATDGSDPPSGVRPVGVPIDTKDSPGLDNGDAIESRRGQQ
jgi:hypothetical protein